MIPTPRPNTGYNPATIGGAVLAGYNIARSYFTNK